MRNLELGKHFLVELTDCDRQIIDDEIELRLLLLTAVGLSGARIISDSFHKFSPQGVTGVVIIAESHVALHTWPEHNYVACDIFTCSARMNVELLISHLHKMLGAHEVFVGEFSRGPKAISKLVSRF